MPIQLDILWLISEDKLKNHLGIVSAFTSITSHVQLVQASTLYEIVRVHVLLLLASIVQKPLCDGQRFSSEFGKTSMPSGLLNVFLVVVGPVKTDDVWQIVFKL